jgi:hypothetical protein
MGGEGNDVDWISMLSDGTSGRKRLEAFHVPPASSEVKQTWIYTSACLHVFIA